MPSKRNKLRRKLQLSSGVVAMEHRIKPSPIVVCLAASVAMLRKAERRNSKDEGKGTDGIINR